MNYYELLEVRSTASPEVIRAAYKSLMQRHHPDRNPADAAAAERAALIVQAYGVLSDSAKRAAYDARQKVVQPLEPQPAPRTRVAPARSTAAFHSNWYFWLLAIAIVVFGGWIVALSGASRKAPSVAVLPPPEVKNPRDKTDPTSADVSAASSQKSRPASPASPPLRLVLLESELKVALLPASDASDFAGRERVLSIPELTVDIGTIDADHFSRLLENQKDVVLQKLASQLARTRYVDLRDGGDRYLSRLVTDILRDITGTKGLETDAPGAPAEPRRYGVVAVSLPQSFSLR